MNWGLLLVLLLVLACPLIMWSMMKGRSGHAGRDDSGAVSEGRDAKLQREVERARIADSRARGIRLRNRRDRS